jgi:hypothetical protein
MMYGSHFWMKQRVGLGARGKGTWYAESSLNKDH